MQVIATAKGQYKGVMYQSGDQFEVDEKPSADSVHGGFERSWMRKLIPVNFTGTIPAFLSPKSASKVKESSDER